jgi:uncharacterized phage protein (TIGR02218 family)
MMSVLESSEITRCLLVELDNGVTATVRLTSLDTDVVAGGNTFSHSGGVDGTRFSVKKGGAPAALDISLPFSDDGPIFAEHVRLGVWRGSTITVWLANFGNSPADREVLAEGFIGLTEFGDRLVGRMEVATLADVMKDIILYTVQPACPFIYGAAHCGLDLAPRTKSGTVTAVTNRKLFTATVTSPGSLDFTQGKVVFTTGDNTGSVQWVRRWTSGTGVFEMLTEFPFDIQIGDTFSVTDGCPHTRAACVERGNVDRYAGFDFAVP